MTLGQGLFSSLFRHDIHCHHAGTVFRDHLEWGIQDLEWKEQRCLKYPGELREKKSTRHIGLNQTSERRSQGYTTSLIIYIRLERECTLVRRDRGTLGGDRVLEPLLLFHQV